MTATRDWKFAHCRLAAPRDAVHSSLVTYRVKGTSIFGFLGEEKHSGRIARAIEKRRATEPFTTTRDLVNLIESVN